MGYPKKWRHPARIAPTAEAWVPLRTMGSRAGSGIRRSRRPLGFGAVEGRGPRSVSGSTTPGSKSAEGIGSSPNGSGHASKQIPQPLHRFRSTTTGVRPVIGSIVELFSMQSLGQASMHLPQALQYCGYRNGLGRSFVAVLVLMEASSFRLMPDVA
jgi:hypothetical protein